MNQQVPFVIRAAAAALAVFVTITELSGVMSFAEPQHSQLVAQTAARDAMKMASQHLHQVVAVVSPVADVY